MSIQRVSIFWKQVFPLRHLFHGEYELSLFFSCKYVTQVVKNDPFLRSVYFPYDKKLGTVSITTRGRQGILVA